MDDYKWKFPDTRDPEWGFCVPYFFLTAIYGGYAYLICYLMETYIMVNRSYDKDNVVSLFVIFSSGLLIVILSLVELYMESVKLKLLLVVLNSYQTFLGKLPAHIRITSLQETQKYVTLGSQNMTPIEAFYHIILIVYVSMLAVVGEICTKTHSKKAAAPCIIGWTRNSCQQQYGAIHLLKPSSIQESSAVLFLAYVHETLQKANQQKILHGSSSSSEGTICSGLTSSVIKDVNDLYNQVETNPPGWVDMSVRMFGILYLLTTPFMFWITQGWMTIIWSVVVFICFGSIIFYRYYVGDMLSNPTSWHIPPVISRMKDITNALDEAVKLRTESLNVNQSGSSARSKNNNRIDDKQSFISFESIRKAFMTRRMEKTLL